MYSSARFLRPGIKGTVHAAITLFEEKDDEDECLFLPVDAENAFNAGNCVSCLWTVCHQWPSSAQFRCNCYSHQLILMVRSEDGYDGHWLASREGVAQGDYLTMILYGISMLLLTLQLKVVISACLQP